MTYNASRNFYDVGTRWQKNNVHKRWMDKRVRPRSISPCLTREDAQEVGDLVKLARTNLLARQTGRPRQTRSARVRETFRLCPGGEQFTKLLTLWGLFLLATRRTGRERLCCCVYVVVVLGSHASLAAGRSSISLTTAYEKSACDLNFVFCRVRGILREGQRSLSAICSHFCSRFPLSAYLNQETLFDPWLRMKNPDAIVVSIVATTGIREVLFYLWLFIVFNKKLSRFVIYRRSRPLYRNARGSFLWCILFHFFF